MLYNPLHYYYYLIKGWLLQTAELLTWATVNIVTADNNYPPLMQPTVQQSMTLIRWQESEECQCGSYLFWKM